MNKSNLSLGNNLTFGNLNLMEGKKNNANRVYDAIAGISVQLLLLYLTGGNRFRFPDVIEGI